MITLKTDILKTALTNVLHAAAEEDSRPALFAIHWHADTEFLVLTGADGYMARQCRVPLFGQPEPIPPTLLPADAMDFVVALCEGSHPIVITPGPVWRFATESVAIEVTPLTAVKPLNYRGVFEEAAKREARWIVVNRDLLLAAITDGPTHITIGIASELVPLSLCGINYQAVVMPMTQAPEPLIFMRPSDVNPNPPNARADQGAADGTRT
jgi:hypothetical protein